MKKYVVYKHTFPNGKIYIGITCQKPERRWRNGEAYQSNLRMTRAIKKYGWDNVRHEILLDGLTESEAFEAEIRLIADMRSQDSQIGYNIAPGGDHPKLSEESKQKIGEKSRGRKKSEDFKIRMSEMNSGPGNYMYGKHHGEETKKKISEARKAAVTDESREKIRQSKIGNKYRVGKKHTEESLRKMSESHKGVEPANKGVRLSEEEKAKMRAYHIRPILCVETGIVYDNCADAARKTGGSHSGIKKAVKHGRMSQGYHWCLAHD